MMFDGLNDDDDTFFTPVSSSNLASLFGVSVTHTNTLPVNTSLSYTAPKQPVSKSEDTKNSSKTKHQSALIVFKEVDAYKLRNNFFQGKCGLALIGNDTVQVYQLLLYKQKTDIMSSAKVNSLLKFTIKEDNYASYCDDKAQNWLVHFNSDLDLTEFSSTLESRGGKINKAHDYLKSDLNSAAIKSKELPRHLDSDNQSDTSSSNVKANIFARMAKMGQKLLPNTSISDGTDSDTEREKSYNKNRKVKRTPANTVPVMPLNTSNEIMKKSTTLPANANAISIQGSSYFQPVSQQYAIINGQSVSIMSQHTNISDDTIPCNSVLPVDNVPSPMMYTQVIPSHFDQLQMYFTENRTHNSEVRMNILRLTDKMEEVLKKVQKMDNAEKINTTERHENILKEENENMDLIIKKLENDIKINSDNYLQEHRKNQKREEILLKENEELKGEIQNNQIIKTELNKKIEELELKIQEYEKNSIISTENHNKELEKRNDKIKETVKEMMSNLYFEINDQIDDERTIQRENLKKIVAQKIKENTYSIISAVSELYK